MQEELIVQYQHNQPCILQLPNLLMVRDAFDSTETSGKLLFPFPKGLAVEFPGVSSSPRTHSLKAVGALPLISTGPGLPLRHLLHCLHKVVETFTLILWDDGSYPDLVGQHYQWIAPSCCCIMLLRGRKPTQ